MRRMMILRSAAASPFARKVRIALALLGFDQQVTIETADTGDAKDSLRGQNPLGKIPALIAEDSAAFYDSRVILEYLDDRAGGGKIIPRESAARFAALRLQALCDGIMDASILLVYEGRWRAADKHEQKWVEHQAGKVFRALAVLEAAPPALAGVPPRLPDVGQIALACALGYRDLRFDRNWRKDHPRLAAWLEDFAALVPAFAATTPKV
jgi:glutathione S-transferase